MNSEQLSRLEKLADLREKGLLSVEELEAHKSRILTPQRAVAPTPTAPVRVMPAGHLKACRKCGNGNDLSVLKCPRCGVKLRSSTGQKVLGLVCLVVGLGWAAVDGFVGSRHGGGSSDPSVVRGAPSAPIEGSTQAGRESKVARNQPQRPDTTQQVAKAQELWDAKKYQELFPLASELARQGEPNGANFLGLMYSDGLGVPQDAERGIGLFRQALPLGAVAEFNLGWTRFVSRGNDPQKLAEGLEHLQRSAEAGFAMAQQKLADMYDSGDSVPRNLETAARYYELCAAQNVAYCKAILGQYYVIGLGNKAVNTAKGVAYLDESAQQGSALGMRFLGDYYAGQGEQGKEKASFYYKKASSAGDEIASLSYASMLLGESPSEQDMKAAIAVLQGPASNGNVMAKAFLARTLLTAGASQNIERGLGYLREAADGGVLGSRIRLSIVLKQGVLVKADPELAAKYRDLAIQGASGPDLLEVAAHIGEDPMYRADPCEEQFWLEAARSKSEGEFPAASQLETARAACKRAS